MRHPGQLKSLSSLLKQRGSHLDTLKIEAEIQAARAKAVRSALTTHLAKQITTGDLQHGLLTLYVPSAGLATELRFEERTLIEKLEKNQLFRGIRRIQIRVRPTPPPDTVRKTTARAPDPKTAHLLRDCADSIEDPDLKRQFQQLAERVSGNPPHSQN